MKKDTRWIGLDVHAETIAVAVAETNGKVRSLGTIANRPEAIRTLVRKVGRPESLRACYEAGPTGYIVYWLLTSLGVKCDVVAPTLISVKAGERVKTDRRDAEKLARFHRSGELTAVWVPDAEHEALRDLVRAREAAKADEPRARHRLQKFLLRHGRRAPSGIRAWTLKHLAWIKGEVRFEHAAQEATCWTTWQSSITRPRGSRGSKGRSTRRCSRSPRRCERSSKGFRRFEEWRG